MSAREIIQELPRLTAAELRDVQRRIDELTRASAEATKVEPALHAIERAGQLVLSGDRPIRQAEVAAILADFP